MKTENKIPAFLDIARLPFSSDRLSVLTLWCTGFILVLCSFIDLEYLLFGFLNLLLSVFIWLLAVNSYRSVFLKTLRYIYPVLLITVLHYEVGIFIPLIYGEHFTFDPLIARLDENLFGNNPHQYFYSILPQQVSSEIIHFFYLTYYPILIGSLVWIWKNRTHDYPRFAFVYIGIFLSYVIFFIFFPVHGPLDFRVGLFDNGHYLASFIDFLFFVGAPDGAAFPSSHVGQSVGVYLLLRPLTHKVHALLIMCIAGISISMVYASIHYAIDAVAGLITGVFLYFLWNQLYLRYLSK